MMPLKIVNIYFNLKECRGLENWFINLLDQVSYLILFTNKASKISKKNFIPSPLFSNFIIFILSFIFAYFSCPWWDRAMGNKMDLLCCQYILCACWARLPLFLSASRPPFFYAEIMLSHEVYKKRLSIGAMKN